MTVDLTQSFNEAMDLKQVLAQLEESKEQIGEMQEKLLQLEEFAERIEVLLKEEIPSKAGSLISEEKREELKKFRNSIAGEFGRMSSRTDRYICISRAS